jgi:plasmid stabilization system protein ParE
VTRPVRLHPLASAEVVDAQLWYEQRVAGLGDRFIVAVRAATDRAARWPNAGSPVRTATDGSVAERQIATPGFPYTVVYRVRDDVVQVLAVHHQHRQPEYWVGRSD